MNRIPVSAAIPKRNLAKLRSALESKRAELAGPRSRDAIAVEKMPEDMDEVQRSAQRELEIHNLNHGSEILRSVRTALVRLSDGSYGTCMRCENEMSAKRLAAVPWAEYCIECQYAVDRDEPKANGRATV